jgi:anti-sigma-K factor RskA
MSREDIAELAAVYALGSLDGADRERFEALLRSGDREAMAALRECEETLAAVAQELRAPAPAHVKAALLNRVPAAPPTGQVVDIGRTLRAPERPARSRWAWVLGGAMAAGLAAVVAGLAVSATYQQRLGALTHEARTLREELKSQQAVVSLLRDPATQVVTLAGQTPSPEARARIVWNASAGGFLVAEGLPAAPPGKAYQLWAIAGNSPPVSAGVFTVPPSGSGTVRVPTLPGVSRVDVFAVTLEPEGGLPAPSGDMYLAGKATG